MPDLTESAPSYLPMDRRHALLAGTSLPSSVVGSALDADLSGFTALTEALAGQLGEQHGAEELARRLNVLYDALLTRVHRYGGTVLGFAGDAFSCWFDGDDGRRAVTCGLELQRCMDACAASVAGDLPPPRLKVAVAVGAARRFLVGDPSVQLLEGLAGALVDELAEAGHDAQPGEVLLAPSAQRALSESVRTGARGELLAFTAEVEPSPWPDVLDGQEVLEDVRAWLLGPVFDRLTAGEGEFVADLRPASALFLRMSGIDYERDEQALDKLDAFVRRVQQVLRRFDGTLVQLTIGDKGSYLYAAFGAPVAHEDDQVRALLAALELRQVGSEDGLVEPVSIGVTRGRLRAGPYGGRERRTYGVLGDAVNLAARLMQAAAPGEVIVTQDVRAVVGDGFVWSTREPLQVKGKAAPVQVATLVRARAGSSRARLSSRGPHVGLIGRREELGALRAALRGAVDGAGQVVTLAAEAGMGKSRLVAELVQGARDDGLQTVVAECPSYGATFGYQIWRPVWHALLGVPQGGAASAYLAAITARLGPELAPRLPVLSPLLGVSVEDTDLTRALDPQVRKTVLEATVSEWLRREVRQPLVVVLEDCHWIDPLSEDLLVAVARAVRELPLLLVLTTRPRGAAEGGDLPVTLMPHHVSLPVTRLSDAEVAELIAQRRAGTSLPSALDAELARLAVRAEGNPFFVEELLAHLTALGPDALAPGRLAELPTTLQSLVLSRIDRLAEQPRSTLKVASAVGRSFACDLLPEAHPALGELREVEQSVGTLTSGEFVVPEQQPLVFAFRHAITQEVAYSTMTPTTASALHGRIGRALEVRAGSDDGAALDLLAHHFGRSDDDDRRRTYVLRAALRAQERMANRAAVEHFRNVLPLLEGEERVNALVRLGRTLSLTGDLGGAAEALVQARSAALSLGGAEVLARVDTERGELARKQGRYDHAERLFTGARDLLSQTKDLVGLAEVLHLEGTMAAQRGDTALARERFEAGLELRTRIGDRRGISRALNGLGIVAEYENDLPRAAELYEEALRLNVELGDPWGTAALTNNQGYVELLQGSPERALPLLDSAVALMREVGDPAMLANFLSNQGDARRDLGDLCAAMAAYDEALTTARAVDERWLVCYLVEDVAVLCSALQQDGAAVQLAAAAEALRVELGTPLPPPSARLLEAKLQPARDRLDEDEQQLALAVGRSWAFDEAIEHALRLGRGSAALAASG